VVSVGLFFTGSGWQEIVPSAIINGYLFCETLIGTTHYLIAVNVSNTANQITVVTFSTPAQTVGGYDWTNNVGALVVGGYPSSFYLAAISPSGTSFSVVGPYSPSVLSGPIQAAGLYNATAQYFKRINISGTTLSDVFVFCLIGADNDTLYYFYISTKSLLASQNPVFITSIVATSYLPLVSLSLTNGNNGGSAFFWNNSLFVLLAGGGVAPRGSFALLATSGFQTFTSVLIIPSGLSLTSYNGFYGIQPAVQDNLLAIPYFDGTNVWIAWTNTTIFPSFNSVLVLSNPPNTSAELRLTAYAYGRYIFVGVGTRVGISGSPYGFLAAYDTVANSLITIVPSISGFLHDPFVLLNPSVFLFPINAYNGTTSSSILSVVLDSGISLVIIVPTTLTTSQAVTVSVSTIPATSNISISLFEDFFDYTADDSDFSGTLIGTAVTNASGVATFTYTPTFNGTHRLIALYRP